MVAGGKHAATDSAVMKHNKHSDYVTFTLCRKNASEGTRRAAQTFTFDFIF